MKDLKFLMLNFIRKNEVLAKLYSLEQELNSEEFQLKERRKRERKSTVAIRKLTKLLIKTNFSLDY